MQAGLLYNLFESDKLGQSSKDWPFLYFFIESEVKIMGFFDGFGFGDVLGIAGDLFGTSSALDAQQSMMREQMAFNREVMQNRHQWEVKDLQAAGLNPLMSVASPTGTLSAPTPAQVPRMNLAQSAAAMSQVKLNSSMAEAALTNADANKISAEAKMIEANNNTNWTNFQMGPEFQLKSQITAAQMDNLIAQSGLANSQKALNLLQKEWLPKLLEANLNEVQMKIATGYLVAEAQDYYYRTSGDAAMVNAQANASQAQAAWYHESLYERSVANTEMLGVKEGELKEKEKEVAIETAKKIAEETKGVARINEYNKEYDTHVTYTGSRYVGEVLGNLNPLKGWP